MTPHVTRQDVVSSAVKPRRGGHQPSSFRPAGLPAVPAVSLPGVYAETLAWAVVSSVFELASPEERRRLLAFLTDRYGEERS